MAWRVSCTQAGRHFMSGRTSCTVLSCRRSQLQPCPPYRCPAAPAGTSRNSSGSIGCLHCTAQIAPHHPLQATAAVQTAGRESPQSGRRAAGRLRPPNAIPWTASSAPMTWERLKTCCPPWCSSFGRVRWQRCQSALHRIALDRRQGGHCGQPAAGRAAASACRRCPPPAPCRLSSSLLHCAAEFDLEGLRSKLDEQGLAVANAQEASVRSRKALADRTKGG